MDIKATSSVSLYRPLTSSVDASSGREAASGAETSETENSAGAVYVSPVLRYDQQARIAVLFYRDADSGETEDQIPPKRVVEEYRRNSQLNGAGDDTGEGTSARPATAPAPLDTAAADGGLGLAAPSSAASSVATTAAASGGSSAARLSVTV